MTREPMPDRLSTPKLELDFMHPAIPPRSARLKKEEVHAYFLVFLLCSLVCSFITGFFAANLP